MPPAASAATSRVFDAGRQLIKVRLVVPLVVGMGALLVWLGWIAFQTYGLQPADGGVLAPLSVRILFGGGVALLGAALAGGILVYTWCYVARIEACSGSGSYRVTLAGLLTGAVLEVGPEELAETAYRDGRFEGRVSVNAPWYSVRVRGRWLPLIVDAQGDITDRRVFERLLAGRAPTAGGEADGTTARTRKRSRR